MAKKSTKSAAAKTSAAKSSVEDVVVKTSVRNTAVPPKTVAIAAAKAPVTHGAISLKAYYMWEQGGGSEFDNWIRAEKELIG